MPKNKISAALVLFCLLWFTPAIFAQSDSVAIKTKNIFPESKSNRQFADSMKSIYRQIEKVNMDCRLAVFPKELNKKRLIPLACAEGVLTGSSLYALNEMWYKNYDRSAFHFFNDSREWMQMDKLGHLKASVTISNFCYFAFRWSGVNKSKSVIYGSALGLGYMTAIEVLDGYSSHWGFSVTDMAVNVLGTAIFASQEMLWENRRVKFKISYHPTQYAGYRPEALGDNIAERMLKDYNGQTHWLSISSGLLMPHQKKVPRWLCVSFGYGAEGMTGGFANPAFNEKGDALPAFDRYRQFYLSFDVDFAQIKTRSKFVRGLLLALNTLKVPFPTLEYNTKGEFKFHYLYF
ncbi:MAG TPA: DUF2279 domain-containing protein [Bacteroidales bacterium]|nr:DUF2279 domain-containing protein [Bacteroidales bacterium]HOH84252.1 DUF2279 domain-containing protein [Bacteroidales bacterium]HPB24122.1 DUF2279 domain-containing protein [Bacteroidales bacterium]HPI31574.1 DUF2279 domain-containing protein [Bacteroidales bacterium]HQN14720.1 DUF2279 domain-containing protein [Bacteroidales bacterium]